MIRYDIPMSGLGCGKCVKKVEETLTQLSDTNILAIDKESVSLTSSHTLGEIIDRIESLGYQAGYHIELSLFGLKCGKCVEKVTRDLENRSQIAEFDISRESLTLHTTLSQDAVIQLIRDLGFNAQIRGGDSPDNSIQNQPPREQIAPLINNASANKDSPNINKDSLSNEDSPDINKDSPGINKDSLSNEDSPDINKDSLSNEDSPNISKDSLSNEDSPDINGCSESTLNIILQGMTCASCVASVEKACLAVDGVEKAQINLAEQSAVLFLTRDSQSLRQALLRSIKNAGYQASIVTGETSQQAELQSAHIKARQQHKKSAVYALLIGAPLMLWGLLGGNMMIRNSSDQWAWGAVGLICLALLATAGRGFYANALRSLKHKRATMDTLVALGTGSAWLYSALVVIAPHWFPQASRHVYFEASAMIIGLISLGHYIEAKAKLRTTESLQALIGLQAKSATVKIGEREQPLPIEEITPGMLVRIKPGEKIPVDGHVVEGESYIDEAMLTGEPMPKLKTIQDEVCAGTINSDGSLLIRATGVGGQTMLARIIQMVRKAQSSKPAIAKLADSVSAVFVPVVVCIAILAALVWWWLGPDPKASYMLVVSTTVLIIACPCALGLATPLSVTVGIGKAAELGILVRDADVLQTASKINTVVFDKTGTLTKGKPVVRDIHLIGDASKAALLKITYALENHSSHPLAIAICDYARERNTPLSTLSEVKNFRGKGITGILDKQLIAIGSLSFLRSLEVEIDDSQVRPYQDNAWTSAAVAIDGRLAGIIAISDPIREESAQAVSLLRKNGIDVVLLTGDDQSVAEKIAREIGITDTIGNLLPDEKAIYIQELQSGGRRVAMVGDGINDAPALAQADIGIAMSSGSDVAIESAQMTLLNSSPIAVNSAIKLSRATVRNMRQNLFGAFVYNTIGIPIAAGILYPSLGFLLSPVIAGAAMAMSSITVVSNANRLRLFKVR